jgi:NADH-quinone oxidoreductase subunit B
MAKDGQAAYFTTRLDDLVNWARKNSLMPFPFGTSCCGIEMMATMASDYDIARFGAEAIRFSPRQADLLIVAGIINAKMAPVLKTVYDQMSEPKWVVSMGACASSGGLLHALMRIQDLIASGDTSSQRRERQQRNRLPVTG